MDLSELHNLTMCASGSPPAARHRSCSSAPPPCSSTSSTKFEQHDSSRSSSLLNWFTVLPGDAQCSQSPAVCVMYFQVVKVDPCRCPLCCVNKPTHLRPWQESVTSQRYHSDVYQPENCCLSPAGTVSSRKHRQTLFPPDNREWVLVLESGRKQRRGNRRMDIALRAEPWVQRLVFHLQNLVNISFSPVRSKG